jgi:hypothetical protein
VGDNGKSVKVARLKVIGAIGVAVLGLYGSIFSTCANQWAASESTVDAMVDQLNSRVIPAIQKVLEEVRLDQKQDRDDAAAMRERIARLEGIIEALPKRWRARKRSSGEGAEEVGPKMLPKVVRKKPEAIPMLQMEQRTLK